ncbi:hypothetical protein CLZ_24725 [Methylobacterium sp. CLZ]|nr:hypothetical protein [Methylobacterium sp. CLZ]QIJ77509.1 hypothetical protein CLZ_24725 [Methylobacterium sp. CLZ]
MRAWGEVGSGVTAAQVCRVVASTVGVGAVARRLGVAECTAHQWAGLAGVSIVARPRTARLPGRQLVSFAAVRDTMLGPLSLRAAAAALGVTAAGPQARARYLGLPTDPLEREAYTPDPAHPARPAVQLTRRGRRPAVNRIFTRRWQASSRLLLPALAGVPGNGARR